MRPETGRGPFESLIPRGRTRLRPLTDEGAGQPWMLLQQAHLTERSTG